MELNAYRSSTLILNQQSNRVLRNTYILLGISLIPTVLGALVGLSVGLPSLMGGSPFLNFLLFLGIAFGFFYGIEHYKDSGIGVALLLGFTFFMGLMLSRLLSVALGFSNGGTLIAMAAGATSVIFAVMATIATVSKRDFSFLNKFLFVGLMLMVLAAVGNLFFQLPLLTLVITAVGALIFSAFILMDISRIVQGGETNYITATLSVYLDVYNLFSDLLQLLMAFGGERD